MNWEEAKQQVAEKYGYDNWIRLKHEAAYNIDGRNLLISNIYTEAAELWQQSNLERIKELEEGLDKMIKAFEKPIDVFDRNDVIDKAKQLLK